MAATLQQCSRCGSYIAGSLYGQTVSCPVCNYRIQLPNNNLFGYAATAPIPAHNALYNPYPIANNYIAPPQAYGRKRAVLIGVSYFGHKAVLKASVNDVMSMRSFLIQRFGFPHASILVLTEYERDPSRTPTKQNIRMAMRWLVQGCRSGDSLLFYYTGHGSQVQDTDGDEIDGFDEALCPVDHLTEGRILDDEINSTMVRPLTTGVKLHAIIDTCASGTLLDLPYMCRVDKNGNYNWESHHINPYTAYKGTSGGTAIAISACDDHENSGESTIFDDKPLSAMTYSFIQALESERNPTYGNILNSMRNKIREALKQAMTGQAPQEPQLSSSHSFGIYSQALVL